MRIRGSLVLFLAGAAAVSTAGFLAVHAQDASPVVPDAVVAGDQPRRIVVRIRSSTGDLEPGAFLGSLLTTDPLNRRQPVRVEPLFGRRGPSPKRAVAGTASRELLRTFALDVPPGLTASEAAAILATDPRIDYAQVDHLREVNQHPLDPFYYSSGSWGQPYRDQWGLVKLDLQNAWDYLTTPYNPLPSELIVVAVVDTGIDRNHEDINVGPGWDFVSNDNDPQDTYGHGTHVAGIIGARRNNNVGIAGVTDVQLMPVRVLSGSGRGLSSTVANGIVYAADNGARIIVLPSGCTSRCPSDPVVESAVRYATGLGVVVITSAGNRGDDTAFYSPQNMVDPKPIVVAASDQNDVRESFSNYGAYVDLIAPGGGTNVAPPAYQPVSNILSLASSTCSPLFCNDGLRVGDGRFLRRAGTSTATAFVAGVAALTMGAGIRAEGGLREQLFANVTDRGPTGYDVMYGFGRLGGTTSVLDLRRYILARIMVPTQGQNVSGSVRIIGAATARDFSHYDIAFGQGAAPTSWQTLGLLAVEERTPQGDLARWDTSALAPGPWTLRLIVQNTGGGRREVRRTVNVVASPNPGLVLDVASDRSGGGTIVVDPASPCEGQARSTRTCTYPTAANTSYTLTALATGHAVFTGWQGDCTGTGSCVVTGAGARTVRARFRGPYHLSYSIEYDHDGSGGVSSIEPPPVPCGDGPGSCYRHGTTVTLEGWAEQPLNSFGWDRSVCGGSGTTCVVVVERDLSLRAGVDSFENEPDQAYAWGPERATTATLVQLQGYSPADVTGAFLYSWYDQTTNTLLGEHQNLSLRLPLGGHKILLTVSDGQDPPNSMTDDLDIVVTEP